ncbi:hypothetical protein J9303_15555 [Bacillaceae bacterium Marseille-Q3522]|nr:hypothetical protein [Bacillaceae bacterium Marseille-Q3522]
MKFLRGVIGYCIAGMLVMSVWGPLSGDYGILGGYIAAFIIISPMWFMNHYVGLINNENESAWVDMALGIAICGTMRDTFMNGGDVLVDSLPTLSFVAIGAIVGGVAAAYIEKDMIKGKKIPFNENSIIEDKKSA